ncbi:MAG: hypothetical protein JJU00_08470 [Opitutales bacterium]|nr:hypothetical protein [Opitutales bacterium]
MGKDRASKGRRSPPGAYRINAWTFLRDVFVRAIDRGQLPLLLIGSAFLIVLWRLPEEQLLPLMEKIIALLASGRILGYVLFILTLVAWVVHASLMRRAAHHEHHRIGREKSEMQELQTRQNLGTSKKR